MIWKFYYLKTLFLAIFKSQFEALRVVFEKNGRKYYFSIVEGVYFFHLFKKTLKVPQNCNFNFQPLLGFKSENFSFGALRVVF